MALDLGILESAFLPPAELDIVEATAAEIVYLATLLRDMSCGGTMRQPPKRFLPCRF